MEDEYSHVIKYIEEACEARASRQKVIKKNRMMYDDGEPYKRKYQGESEAGCVAREKSDIVRNAVENVVSATLGGPERFSFAPFDPSMDTPPALMDYLDMAAKNFYQRENVESANISLIRDALVDTVSGYVMTYNEKRSYPELLALSWSQIILDPSRNKLCRPRYTGYQVRKSLADIKKWVGKQDQLLTKNMQDADISLQKIMAQINSGAGTEGASDLSTSDPTADDIECLYSDLVAAHREQKSKDPSSKYQSDDVEVTYLYEHMGDKNILWTVINRKYVVSKQSNPLRKVVTKELKIPKDNGKFKTVKKKYTCELDHPMVILEDENHRNKKFPSGRLERLHDDFSRLCDYLSILEDNIRVMAPLNFVSSSTDSKTMLKTANQAGSIIESNLVDTGVFSKTHDLSPLLMRIDKIENNIKRTIGSVDAFDLQGMIGDRARGKEVISANAQVMQIQNSFIAKIEAASAQLGEKFVKMMMIFNDTIVYTDGKVAGEIDIDEIIGDYLVTAKLKSSVKLERLENSRRAMELIGYISGLPNVDLEAAMGQLLPIALDSTVSREDARKIYDKDRVEFERAKKASMDEIQALSQANAAVAGGLPVQGQPQAPGGEAPQPQQGQFSSAAGESTQQPDLL